jgi:hypothetical protein
VKVLISAAAVVVLTGCASTDYEPVQERSFGALVSEGCRDDGEQMLVTGYVSRAYEDTVVLWDGIDPQATVAVKVPGRTLTSRMRGWFGDSKHEVSQERLNDLITRKVPVTVNLTCQGENMAPVVTHASYTDAQGQRVAIAY